MINNINGSTTVSASYETKEKSVSNKAAESKEQEPEAAVLELNKPQESSATYSRPKVNKNVDMDEVNRLIQEAEKSYEGLRTLIRRLMEKQGVKLEDLLAGKAVLMVDDETRAEAQKVISEDGQWGVKAVSDRLVDFAKAISGNDKSKLTELKDAIDKGFKEAEKAFGGKLPDISHQTYKETMRKLDEWAQSE
jgi:predicted transcriptional regulator